MASHLIRNQFIRLLMLTALALCLASIGACTEERAEGERIRITIKGTSFELEPALDHATRVVGLGGRESLTENGGMLFVFKLARRQSFYMKDCLMDIDIAYLDDSGRVTAVYTMLKEEPKREDESMNQYELRLKRYPSRFPSSVAIEVKPGTFADLGLKQGDVIDLDIKALKARAE